MDQLTYIEILFGDCGFDGPTKRAWLYLEYKVKYADQLSISARSMLIDRLKEMKEDQKG